MIIDFIIEDLLLDSYLQKNFHTPTVNQKSISMKEYLNRYIPCADYDKANKSVNEIIKQMKNKPV